MSAEYGPIGKPVADSCVRGWRDKHYNPHSLDVGGSLEEIVDRIDDIMESTLSGCGIIADAVTQYHQYERMFGVVLNGRPNALNMRLAIARVGHAKPVHYMTEGYIVTIDHSDDRRRKLFGSSYAITRYVGSQLTAEVQHSLDISGRCFDVPTPTTEESEGGLWHNITPYEIQQLDDDLCTLRGLQLYDNYRKNNEWRRYEV